MARKRRFRFGLPTVFAGRPSVGGVGLGCQPIRFAAAAKPPKTKKTPSAMKEAGEKVLKLLSRIADQPATVRGSRVIVAGIISLVIGGAGYPALTVYGLTLAFWQGPEIFAKAIDALTKNKK